MRVVNLTPHKITLIDEKNNKKEYLPSGKIARVVTMDRWVYTIDGFPVYKGEPRRVENLPEEENGFWYIVSLQVLQHCKDREDLLSPDTSRAVRDEEGNIIGVRGWRIV